MTVTAKDLHGVMAMMPAFATPDAGDITATSTVDIENLADGVDRIIKDGVDVLTTTGSSGECYNLLFDEFKELAAATVETANHRVPVMIGATSPNPREVVQKLKFVEDACAPSADTAALCREYGMSPADWPQVAAGISRGGRPRPGRANRLAGGHSSPSTSEPSRDRLH